MRSTTSSAAQNNTNYAFLLKCLAGIAFFSLVIAMLMKPKYIVVATASLLAPTLLPPTVVSAAFLLTLQLASLALVLILATVLSCHCFSSSPIYSRRYYHPTHLTSFVPQMPDFFFSLNQPYEPRNTHFHSNRASNHHAQSTPLSNHHHHEGSTHTHSR